MLASRKARSCCASDALGLLSFSAQGLLSLETQVQAERAEVLVFLPQQPETALVVAQHALLRLPRAAETRGPWGDERGVKIHIANEPVARKLLGPHLRVLDVEVGDLLEIEWG